VISIFLQSFGQRRWAHQSGGLAVVLSLHWKGEVLYCGYLLANGNRRSCHHTPARSHSHEARISCKYTNPI